MNKFEKIEAQLSLCSAGRGAAWLTRYAMFMLGAIMVTDMTVHQTTGAYFTGAAVLAILATVYYSQKFVTGAMNHYEQSLLLTRAVASLSAQTMTPATTKNGMLKMPEIKGGKGDTDVN